MFLNHYSKSRFLPYHTFLRFFPDPPLFTTKNKQTAYGPSTEERSGEQTVSDLQGKPRPTNAIVQ